MQQLNSLGVPGYQEPLFNEKGVPIMDDTVNNAFSREINYAKQKYGIVNVKKSDSSSLSETGKQELAYSIKQRDVEQPVGFTFADTTKHELTHDYGTYTKTKQELINAHNTLYYTVVEKLGVSGKDRKALAIQLESGDYSALKGIPDSEGYVEQFKQFYAKQKLYKEVDKDYTSWLNGRKKDKNGNVMGTYILNGKKQTVPVDPKTEKGKATLFNIYTNQPGYQKNVITNYTADNVSIGVGPKATIAIGKTLADLGGNLSLNFSSAKNSNAVYTSVDGTSKVRLVTPEAYKAFVTSKTAPYGTDKTVYKVDKNGNYLIPALESNGNIKAQNLVNLGLATDLSWSQGTASEDENEPGETGGATSLKGLTINGKKTNLDFKSNSARIVDRHVNGRPAIAIPVTGGDFSVIATVDASTIQQPDLQNWINSPARKANQNFQDWKSMVPPVLTPIAVSNGLTVGKSPAKGWYVISKTGKIMAPAEAGKTQEYLMSLYYKKSRKE
jgi:hypothetical protein